MTKCYVLTCTCYSGNNGVAVFYKKDDARRYMEENFKTEIRDLENEKYVCRKSINDIEAHLYVPDSDIYYDWVIEETNIR